jgi:hypothetical protein
LVARGLFVPSGPPLIFSAMRKMGPTLLLALVLAGCGTGDDREQAVGVVERFYDAVRHDRAEEACSQLSTAAMTQLESQAQQSCRGAVTQLEYEGGGIVDAHVYLTNAKVDLRNGESTFLSLETDGWKITALACRPEQGKPRDHPYACEVEA